MSDVVRYRLRPAVGLRMVGVGFLWLAAFVVLEILRATTDLFDGPGFGVLRWVFAAVFILVAGAGAFLIFDPRPALQLDDDGFTNRTSLRRGTVRQAKWNEVADVQRSDTQGGPTLQIHLADGRRSPIVANLLAGSVSDLEQQVRQHLNDAHGYRPL